MNESRILFVSLLWQLSLKRNLSLRRVNEEDTTVVQASRGIRRIRILPPPQSITILGLTAL